MGEEKEAERDLAEALRLLEPSIDRLADGEALRRTLPGGGRVEIERPVPFLLAYRYPEGEDVGTSALVTSEAAWICVSGAPRFHGAVSRFCSTVEEALAEHVGMCVMIELWAGAPRSEPPRRAPGATKLAARIPWFVVHHRGAPRQLLDPLAAELAKIEIAFHPAEVEVRDGGEHGTGIAPPGLAPLLSSPDGPARVRLGIEVGPIYRGVDGEGEEVSYPLYLSALRRQLSTAMRRSLHALAGEHARSPPEHYAALGPRARSDRLREVEAGLCDLSDSFDLLLLVTPINAAEARAEFERSGGEEEPALHYRPLPFRPGVLKRRLYALPVEELADPTLALLLEEKRRELDLQVSALAAIGTPDFLLIGRQLYGDVSKRELQTARRVLEVTAGPEAARQARRPYLELEAILGCVRSEIGRYTREDETFSPPVEVRDDIASGMMASNGRLLIADDLRVSPTRMKALLHHEIGTHLVVHHNGRAQPLRLLGGGLAGYEELQEGLAVLSEIISGGITGRRWRTLAARVVACDALVRGAGFLDCYRLLRRDHGLSGGDAFGITLRVHRGGGFPKDAIYLRGLLRVLSAIDRGIDLESLYVGRLALDHATLVQELRVRGHVRPPRLTPRYLRDQACLLRLQAIRDRSVPQLAVEALR